MDKALKHQLTDTVDDTYIAELCNKYTGFIRFKAIDLVHHSILRGPAQYVPFDLIIWYIAKTIPTL